MPLLLVYSVRKENEFTCPGETTTCSTYYMKQLSDFLETRPLVTKRRSRVYSHETSLSIVPSADSTK